jgi:hypothetical protein
MPKLRVASVELDGREPLEVVRRRFEVNGWDFSGVLRPLNAGTRLFFSKPENAPDNQPFLEPNSKVE